MRFWPVLSKEKIMAKVAKNKKTPNELFMELVNREETLVGAQFFTTGLGYNRLKGRFSTIGSYHNELKCTSTGGGYHKESDSLTHALNPILEGFLAKKVHALVSDFIAKGRPDDMVDNQGYLKCPLVYIWVTGGLFKKDNELSDIESACMSTAGVGNEEVASVVRFMGLHLLQTSVYTEGVKEKHWKLIVPRPIEIEFERFSEFEPDYPGSNTTTFCFFQYGVHLINYYNPKDALAKFKAHHGELTVIHRDSKLVAAYKLEGGR